MVTRRTRLMSDIEQSFQEVYQSLVIDRSLDGSFQQRRNNYRVFSRSESCLTLHKCSGTSTKVREEKKNVNLKDSTLISKKHHCVEAFESSERRNSSYPDYPNHWCCDFWMMVYRTPLVVNVSRRKRRLRDILKVLERCGWKRTVVTCGKCSRAHPFLQRNLRACKNAQKAFFKYRQKRSQIKGGSSACKSNANLQKMRTSQNSEKVKKPFVFVIDSSQEEDADLILKEQKRKTDTKRRSLNKSKLVCNLSSPHSQKQDYNRSEKTALVRHTQLNSCNLSKNSPSEFFIEESEDSECSNIVRSETTPQESSESFTWVNCGSFRQMLAKLNSGCLRSAAIKEH
ncbi:hypothetical protein GDO86_017027 [Hymenochirus boettgeri]|uniref:Uncharacterized protein n=1 Tax=Hymenochirus boettgeri TaxID=247094 RepID=A0A8T2ILE1_9PIPI|nr:hypothetical protein GDO86_017027 [Hymenochirus boettgeri]